MPIRSPSSSATSDRRGFTHATRERTGSRGEYGKSRVFARQRLILHPSQVNRLTRELSLLRQQSASVASTTSSTSTGLPELNDHGANHLLSGASHPTPSRRHRSSSSLSTRSANTAASGVSGLTGNSTSTIGTTGGVAGSVYSGIAPARDPVLTQAYQRDSLSRQGSIASSRRSEASSPSLASSLQQSDPFSTYVSHHVLQPGHNSQATTGPRSSQGRYMGSNGPTSRFEETAHHRSELETVKRENESLRRKVRELERALISRQRALDRARNDPGASTEGVLPPETIEVVAGQVVNTAEDDDAVHVGESAGSAGVGGGI